MDYNRLRGCLWIIIHLLVAKGSKVLPDGVNLAINTAPPCSFRSVPPVQNVFMVSLPILIYLENKYNYIMHIIAFSIIKLFSRLYLRVTDLFGKQI